MPAKEEIIGYNAEQQMILKAIDAAPSGWLSQHTFDDTFGDCYRKQLPNGDVELVRRTPCPLEFSPTSPKAVVLTGSRLMKFLVLADMMLIVGLIKTRINNNEVEYARAN